MRHKRKMAPMMAHLIPYTSCKSGQYKSINGDSSKGLTGLQNHQPSLPSSSFSFKLACRGMTTAGIAKSPGAQLIERALFNAEKRRSCLLVLMMVERTREEGRGGARRSLVDKMGGQNL